MCHCRPSNPPKKLGSRKQSEYLGVWRLKSGEARQQRGVCVNQVGTLFGDSRAASRESKRLRAPSCPSDPILIHGENSDWGMVEGQTGNQLPLYGACNLLGRGQVTGFPYQGLMFMGDVH